jgi:hypothetical protein
LAGLNNLSLAYYRCGVLDGYPQILGRILTGLRRPTLSKHKIEIIGSPVQDVDAKEFEAVKPTTFLFIISMHVGKVHSDVIYYFSRFCRGVQSGRVYPFPRYLLSVRISQGMDLRGESMGRSGSSTGVLAVQQLVSDRLDEHFSRTLSPRRLSGKPCLFAARTQGGSI